MAQAKIKPFAIEDVSKISPYIQLKPFQWLAPREKRNILLEKFMKSWVFFINSSPHVYGKSHHLCDRISYLEESEEYGFYLLLPSQDDIVSVLSYLLASFNDPPQFRLTDGLSE